MLSSDLRAAGSSRAGIPLRLLAALIVLGQEVAAQPPSAIRFEDMTEKAGPWFSFSHNARGAAIKKWWVLQNVKPLTLRFDVPFFVSNTPYNDPAHFKFRWVVGISRTF